MRQQGARSGGSAGGRGRRGARRGGRGGAGAGARGGGACLGFSVGPVRGQARRGGEEGEARSAVLYRGSLTVPRAEAAGTRGRGVPRDDAWHWDVRAPDTVSTLLQGSARALSSGASHPAPSPWVELGSTQAVLCCAVLCFAVLCCAALCCSVLCCAVRCAVLRCAVLCCAVLCCAVLCCAVLCCAVLCCVFCCAVLCCSLCCAVLCCAVPCCVLCCAVLCCAVLCCLLCCLLCPAVQLVLGCEDCFLTDQGLGSGGRVLLHCGGPRRS